MISEGTRGSISAKRMVGLAAKGIHPRSRAVDEEKTRRTFLRRQLNLQFFNRLQERCFLFQRRSEGSVCQVIKDRVSERAGKAERKEKKTNITALLPEPCASSFLARWMLQSQKNRPNEPFAKRRGRSRAQTKRELTTSPPKQAHPNSQRKRLDPTCGLRRE